MNRKRQPFDRTERDRGYAAILTALLLVPLMGFAGFAVDIGAWYSQASSLQRAARAEATRNGFTHGVDGIAVSIVDTGNNRLEVEIIDTSADLYFASLFIDNVTIGRRAVAEYVDSVPPGSPEGRFGTGDLNPGAAPAVNFWAALSGYCTSKDMGDQVMVQYEWIGWGGCNRRAVRGISTATTTLAATGTESTSPPRRVRVSMSTSTTRVHAMARRATSMWYPGTVRPARSTRYGLCIKPTAHL